MRERNEQTEVCPCVSAADIEIQKLHWSNKTVIARKGSCGLSVLISRWTAFFSLSSGTDPIKDYPTKSDSTNG